MKVVRTPKIQNAIDYARKEHEKRTQIALRVLRKNAAFKKQMIRLKQNAAENFHDAKSFLDDYGVAYETPLDDEFKDCDAIETRSISTQTVHSILDGRLI